MHVWRSAAVVSVWLTHSGSNSGGRNWTTLDIIKTSMFKTNVIIPSSQCWAGFTDYHHSVCSYHGDGVRRGGCVGDVIMFGSQACSGIPFAAAIIKRGRWIRFARCHGDPAPIGTAYCGDRLLGVNSIWFGVCRRSVVGARDVLMMLTAKHPRR